MNKIYISIVTILTFLLPSICFITDHLITANALSFNLFTKWFIFSAVGLRLLLAGIRQTTKPEFTAKEIFHIQGIDSFPIIRELGFANLCFGLIGIISLFKADWRPVSAFASGLYYGLAGVQHLIKKPVGINERFALWTDLFIFIILVLYFFLTIR